MSTSSALPTSVTAASDAFFPVERAAGILSHMNSDHADAVLGYARHFGKRTSAEAAVLTGIDQTGIDVNVIDNGSEETIRIAFEKPLTGPEDAHMVLVGMAIAAKKAAAPAPAAEPAVDPAFNKARAAIEQLKTNLRTGILGTANAAGDPDASVAPLALSADGTLHTYVSEMSAHTKNLRETGRASVLVIEDEGTAAQLLARKRLTLRCTTKFIERDSATFTTVMAAFKVTFGPVMTHLEGMTDFHLVELTPSRGRLVAGFGQAFEVDPKDWTKLAHVTGDGQGHGHGHARK